MASNGGEEIDFARLKKRKATTRVTDHASRNDDGALLPLGGVKKSKRTTTTESRDESEFVSVEVGLREFHKRMASAATIKTSKTAAGKKASEKKELNEKNQLKKNATTTRKAKNSFEDDGLGTETTVTTTRRAPAKSKAAAIETTKPNSAKMRTTAGTKRGGTNGTPKKGNALAEARAAAMQQQQERVRQRVLNLQHTTTAPTVTESRATVGQQELMVESVQAPVPPPHQPTQQLDDSIANETNQTNRVGDHSTQSSQGFIEEDVDEDLAFLQALEEVERKLLPTTISSTSSPSAPRDPIIVDGNGLYESQGPVGVTPEVERGTVAIMKEEPKSVAAISAPLPAVTAIPMELLAEYERLKRENEELRRSNGLLQVVKANNDEGMPTAIEATPLETTTELNSIPHTLSEVPTNHNRETCTAQDITSGQSHLPLSSPDHTGLVTCLQPTQSPESSEGTMEDEDMASPGNEHERNDPMDYVEHDIGYEGVNEENCVEDEDVDEEDEQQDEKHDGEDNRNDTLPDKGRVSTIDRGNYSQYLVRDREVDEDDDSSLSQELKPVSDFHSVAVGSHSRPPDRAPRVTHIKEPMGPPSVNDDSETESDEELRLTGHRHAALLSTSSSSFSEESDDESAETGAAGSNGLEAALRAATGRAPVKAQTKVTTKRSADPFTNDTRPSPEKRVRVDMKSEDSGNRSSAPVDELSSVNRKDKKRRATFSLSAKDKSTLMWPTLDDFYDFVLDLTPRRVLHSDPLHLQLLRAYEKARAQLPMHYPGLTQYCYVQQESILEELLASVRNAEELSLYNSSRTRLWLSSISPCSTSTGHSSTMKNAQTPTTTSVSPNVIFMESGFSGKSAVGKSDFIITFQDTRTSPNQKSALSDYVSGDLLALRSPQWRDNDIYAFGIVLCSSIVAVGGTASSRGGGGPSLNPDQLCVLIRAPSATEDDPDAGNRFASIVEMCLVNQGSAQWSWSLEQVHNLTTSAREFQAIKSVRFFKPETKEMLMSGIIPEIVKSEQSQIVEPRKKLSNGLYEELEHKYNPSQLQAILGAISDDSSISIIQGPPGTGKTKTILGVLSALLDGAALTASRQAQAKSRIRIGASLEQTKSTAQSTQDKKSVAQESIRILVAAPSNAAVDELIVRLLSEGIYDARQRKSYRPRIVRVGRPESLQQQQRLVSSGSNRQSQQDITRKKKWRKYASEVEEILLENLVNKNKSAFPTAKQARQTIIQNAQIVFCTLSGAGSVAMCELQSQHFDALVIDEAAQAVEASLLIPFKFQPSRIVLVGDHRQLPATVISKRLIELGYDRSLFQRLVENGSRVFLLTQQYRMHPEISWFPSTYFYNSKLIEAPQMKEWTTRKYHRESFFRPFVFYDVLSGQQSQVTGSKSLRNVSEMECILQLLTRLVIEQYPELEWRRRIGIIAPYKQQIYELRTELQRWEKKYDKRLDIEVNTVDGFQGREKEVIIYSCVRTSRGGQGRGSSRANGQTIEAFWADERRMNVAITRAKSSLWIIGNSTLLKQSAAWRALITHAKDSRRYIVDDELMGSQTRSTSRDRSRDRSRDKRGTEKSRDRSRDRSRERM